MSDFRYDPNRIYDPDRVPNRNNIEVEIPTYLKWIYGGVGLALVGGLLAFAFTNDRSNVASNERPGVNAPAQTTGSAPRAPAETTGSGGATKPAPMQKP